MGLRLLVIELKGYRLLVMGYRVERTLEVNKDFWRFLFILIWEFARKSVHLQQNY